MYRKQHLEIFGPDGHFLTLDEILNRAVKLARDDNVGSISSMARDLKISRSTLYIYWRKIGL